jgi:high frequency lysogenization protein
VAYTNYDRTIAFAGICQAVTLVQQVAKQGHCDSAAFEASIAALVNMNPSSTLDVFGHERDLKVGLECLAQGIDGSTTGSELTRYIIGLLALERKLSQRPDADSQLGDRLTQITRQMDHYDLYDPQMINNIAAIYVDVISPIGPKIQVSGNPAMLQQTAVQDKVRALLLSGIRSTVLWHQVGGKRRHLIFSRKKMAEQAKILLARI